MPRDDYLIDTYSEVVDYASAVLARNPRIDHRAVCRMVADKFAQLTLDVRQVGQLVDEAYFMRNRDCKDGLPMFGKAAPTNKSYLRQVAKNNAHEIALNAREFIEHIKRGENDEARMKMFVLEFLIEKYFAALKDLGIKDNNHE